MLSVLPPIKQHTTRNRSTSSSTTCSCWLHPASNSSSSHSHFSSSISIIQEVVCSCVRRKPQHQDLAVHPPPSTKSIPSCWCCLHHLSSHHADFITSKQHHLSPPGHASASPPAVVVVPQLAPPQAAAGVPRGPQATLWCSSTRRIIITSRWFDFDCNDSRTAIVFTFLSIPANLKTEYHLLGPGLQHGQHAVPLSCSSVPSSLVVNNSASIITSCCASDSRWRYTGAAARGTFCTRLFSCSCNQHQHVPTSLYVTLFTPLSKISRGMKPCSSSLKIFRSRTSTLPSTSATDFPPRWGELSIDLGINKVQTSPGIGNARSGSHLVSNWWTSTLVQSFCNNSCIWKSSACCPFLHFCQHARSLTLSI